MKSKSARKRQMRKLLCMLPVLLCLICAAAASEGTGEVLSVGVPVDRCPIFYLDEKTNEIIGIGADLMRAAAENAGYAVEFRRITEGTLKEALDNGDYDVVMPFGSAIASASGHPTVVSDNLFQTPFTIVTEGKRALPEFNHLRVGMLKSQGGVAETVRQLYPGMEINMYETMAECVKALRDGQVDALLQNSYIWSYVLQKPAYENLAVQPSAMFTMDFRAGTQNTPAGRALIDRLNEGIAALSETRRQAIALDYTSRRLYRYDFSDYLFQYRWVLVTGGLLIALLLLVLIQKQRMNRIRQEEKMRQLLDTDPLTGALSLTGFRKRVEELLRAHPDIPYLLSYNNIKNFKYINDSLGRKAGDDLLRFWVQKSREHLTEEEAIGRLAGDRFAILHRASGDEKILQDIRDVADPVRDYFISQGKENHVRICSGIYVLTPKDYSEIDVDRMLDCARVAARKVRDTRKEGYEFYNPEQWQKGQKVSDICNHLPAAMQNGEIQVWYQPQVNFETGKIIGAEALCRWNHASLGWISPAEFIPLLEESDLIFDLDCFVWETVCRDLQKWNGQGMRRSVSVNLSRRDIREDRNIPEKFSELIRTYGLSQDQLRIEITETAFAENANLVLQTTVRLREMGFLVEMDDFGSGYSSLHMLKEVPVDRIKLDLHFLSGSGDPEKGRIIISYIIQMIRSLGLHVIAEGVENITQADFLLGYGCSEMQGFYFHKPMPADEYEQIG